MKRQKKVRLVSAAQAAAYHDWHQRAQALFTDYRSMPAFPVPPSPSSGNCNSCRSEVDRPLEACDCEIRAAVAALGTPLKQERARWHPDRFRPAFKEMAQIVFQVVDAMYHKQEFEKAQTMNS